MSASRSSAGWGDAADAGVLRDGSAVTAMVFSDDTPPPRRADIAASTFTNSLRNLYDILMPEGVK
jgi:hypothetical protein